MLQHAAHCNIVNLHVQKYISTILLLFCNQRVKEWRNSSVRSPDIAPNPRTLGGDTTEGENQLGKGGGRESGWLGQWAWELLLWNCIPHGNTLQATTLSRGWGAVEWWHSPPGMKDDALGTCSGTRGTLQSYQSRSSAWTRLARRQRRGERESERARQSWAMRNGCLAFPPILASHALPGIPYRRVLRLRPP